MVQIVISVILAAVGIVLQLNANMDAKYSFERHEGYIVIGLLMQIAAVFFGLIGLKRYFLKDIIDELKKLSAPKG